ncbi:hypothetical protein Catovirus_1_62 [Catovirus CTV1]|uniref:Uncharacterized protein n=1 Tax=Catovirus CTV1 TaxID=1977631 RepID=A0A1V0S8H8_9VIRU|nr:hypothetical protein Catovirus_1_62 [Catovirus CTV1]
MTFLNIFQYSVSMEAVYYYDFENSDIFKRNSSNELFLEGLNLLYQFENKHYITHNVTKTPLTRWNNRLERLLNEKNNLNRGDRLFNNYRDLINDENKLIDDAVKKTNKSYEFYVFPQNCHNVAFFVTFPILKLSYPNQNFYICQGNDHCIVTNQKPNSTVKYLHNGISLDNNKFLVFDINYYYFHNNNEFCTANYVFQENDYICYNDKWTFIDQICEENDYNHKFNEIKDKILLWVDKLFNYKQKIY